MRSLAAVFLASGVFFSWPLPVPSQQAGNGPSKKPLSQTEMLARFDQLGPAARLQLIHKITKAEKEFQPAMRKDLTVVIQERASLEGALVSDVICRVKEKTKSGVATTIKWLIEDGSQVQKGDKLIELDDSALQEQLREQKIKADQARAGKVAADDDLDLVRKENDLAVRFNEIDVRIAELELKKNAGKEQLEKDILALKVERARLLVLQAKSRGKARQTQAEAILRGKEAIAELEASRVREIEEEIKQCRLTAPRDGLAVYYIPESTRGGFGKQALTAVGEQVSEGQKLMQVCDPEHWLALTRVHESLIAQVRNGQNAIVRVDAFPGKAAFAGRVQSVAPLASAPDWLAADVKVYPVRVVLPDKLPGLKPGMSASVSILVDSKADVVQIPVQAVLRSGQGSYCFVKIGQELQKRRVVPGLRSDLAVEIREGLKEGEQVLRDPRGLVRRMRSLLGRPAGEESKAPQKGEKTIWISSELSPEDIAASRNRLRSYGLTFKDLESISTLPTVSAALPVRHVPQEARYLERTTNSFVVATTPECAWFARLQTETGRFLSAADLQEKKNVIVLGAAIADDLFPDGNAIGKVVTIGRHGYAVIGVLPERVQRQRMPLDVGDHSIYLPLSTFQARFGRRVPIRKSGRFSVESVELNDIYLTVSAEDVSATLENIRTILEDNHRKNDWKIQVAK